MYNGHWKLYIVLLIFSMLEICMCKTYPRGEPDRYGSQNNGESTFDIRMPFVHPKQPDEYICTAKQVDPEEKYVVRFVPHADIKRVHHLLLFGCSNLGEQQQLYPGHGDCGHVFRCEDMTIMYAWGKNAPPITLPPDVGFRTGGRSKIRYLMLQIHYAESIPEGETDESGVTLHVTNTPQQFVAGILLLVAVNTAIPPRTPNFHIDINCRWRGNEPLHPFAYRVHAHRLGQVISGYTFSRQTDDWTLLAKGNPQWPQSFYPMEKIFTINKGDIVAARCTYNSSQRESVTKIGSSTDDEMCNLYIMYYTRNKMGPSFAKCVDIEVPSLVKALPLGSDQPLPPNPALDAETEGHKSHEPTQTEYHVPLPVPQQSQIALSDENLIPANPNLSPVGPFNNEFKYKAVNSWFTGGLKLGQVSAVTLDNKGNVIIFHRGNHVWNSLSFDYGNKYLQEADGPISVPTVITLDPATGQVLHHWGENLFYMPHGLSVDIRGNIWITDVALHQVMKFPEDGATQALLTVGVQFIPGNDETHFCKPTSVAVAADGTFFVGDGYCNSRIVVFTPAGKYMRQWGRSDPHSVYPPATSVFNVPHKVVLIEDKGFVCVADRENGRIQCFTAENGYYQFQIVRGEFGGKLFSIAYSPSRGGLLYAVNGPPLPVFPDYNSMGFVFNLTNQDLLNTFVSKSGSFSQPHDIAVSLDGEDVYVCEIGPNTVWKFTRDMHKSTKKVLDGLPPPTHQPLDLMSKDRDHTGNVSLVGVAETESKKTVLLSDDFGSFGTSMIIMAFLAIPILILIVITIAIRFQKRGKLQQCSLGHLKGWLGGYRTPRPQDKFNLGNLLNPHKGFDRVALDESDMDGDDGSESDVEEFSAAARKA